MWLEKAVAKWFLSKQGLESNLILPGIPEDKLASVRDAINSRVREREGGIKTRRDRKTEQEDRARKIASANFLLCKSFWKGTFAL